ncbi:MAG: N-6 DNA methylase [Dermatophilaceae bacterium]
MALHPLDSPDLRKARGAFFTPELVARYVTEWAVRSSTDRVLEPSCGEAAFLLEAGRRLSALGAATGLSGQLSGAELHAESAYTARSLLAIEGHDVEISVGDFLRAAPRASFDAVIGNPPYVRYQAFSGESRAAAQRAALRAGVRLTNLASSWAAFTLHSALHVSKGGRLGLVLPAEMLSVNYAAPVRDFLMQEFRQVRLVLFAERIFPGVMEEVVLLLAEGRGEGPVDHCEIVQSKNGSTLAELAESDVRRWHPANNERWSSALLPAEVVQLYTDRISSEEFVALSHWGDTTLGMVTGNNEFFALTENQVKQRALAPDDLVRLSPPGSRHLRGLSLTTQHLQKLDRAGQASWLFRPARTPSTTALKYIAHGEMTSVDHAYKCRVRTPWWRVPYLRPADLLLTYMNADTARLCTNTAAVHHLNSVHGVYLTGEHRRLGRDLLALAALNSVTLLGAEMVGRSYGGGILKIEPKEADRWPMPSPALVEGRAEALRGVRRRVRDLLATGRLVVASEIVDATLWPTADREQLASLRLGRQLLHDRRVARSRSR